MLWLLAPSPAPLSTRLVLLFLRRDVPGDEAALRYVPPDPSDALSLLSLLVPGNVVVADVPISPHQPPPSSRQHERIAGKERPMDQAGRSEEQPHPQAHLDTQEQQHQSRGLGRAHEGCRMEM